MNVHFSSKKDTWETPKDFFDKLDSIHHFDLDPCCLPSSAKCTNYFTPEDDGLSQPWFGKVFMNPPYGKEIVHWIRKAHKETQLGNTELIIALVPARTDTRWFHDYIYKRYDIEFIKGRLKFGGAKNSAPFPSMLVYF